MSLSHIDPRRSALLLLDLQNDFFHADGAMRRSGLEFSAARSLVESLIRLSDDCREAGMLLVGSAFTIIADTQNDALIPLFVRDLGVNLVRGDFQVSKWGHQLIEEVQPVHYIVDKTGPSAFFRTELDVILRHRGVDNVFLAGLNARRSVVASAFDAMGLGLKPIIVKDCSADFDAERSELLLNALEGVFELTTSTELSEWLKP